MGLIKTIKKNTFYLRSPFLSSQLNSIFFVLLIFRYSLKDLTEVFNEHLNCSNSLIFDSQKKKFYQTSFFENQKLTLKLKGNSILLFSTIFVLSHLLILNKLLKQDDLKLFLAIYKNFFFNYSRLITLTSFCSLSDIYIFLIKANLSIIMFFFKTTRLIVSLIGLHLYRLQLFLLKQKI